MENNKKLNKILIAIGLSVLVIILVILIMFFGRNKSTNEVKKIESISIKDAKAQLYSSPKTPSIQDDDKIIGSQKSTLKIFVYEDNSSIYSARLADTLNKIYSENKDKFAIIVRPFMPKGSIDSKTIFLAIDCAAEQNKWIEMRAYLFDKVKSTNLNLNNLSLYAKELSLDESKFSTCLTNPEKSAKIEKLSTETINYNILGAPTIFINSEMIIGARPYDDYVDSNGDKIEGLNTIIKNKLNN